ncbi:MAG TPA: alpha/beta hydrolase [Solirubrobacteraceae bacterium]|nr:alpha/beta hydrolase [Solirubrobacteraceae bacterium]
MTRSGEQFAQVGQIKLCHETFGDPSATPMLLVMGLASQMVIWDDDFCEQLADRGFWVIRFDNRDIGRSTILRDRRPPKTWQLLVRDQRGASYTLGEMADDAVGLLDQLGVERAHVVGVSMGGMIAQLIAIRHRDRVLSLVSIMSTTGNRRVGRPHPRLIPHLLRRARTDREGYISDFVETYRVIGSSTYPRDPERLRATGGRCFDRGIHPAGAARQLAAIVTTEDRTPLLRQLDLPATVIHGTADRLVTPSGGRATAEAIPGATLVMIEGMGHDLPPEVWPQVIDAIVRTAGVADSATGAAAG